MKRHKILKPYTGRLTPEKIADGMSAAGRNAKRLAEDATMLFEAKRYPSACALAILSIEESGKLGVLLTLARAASDDDAKHAWKDYRDHQAKNTHCIIAQLDAQGAQTFLDAWQMFDPESDHRSALDALKQLSFYTDRVDTDAWSEPEIVVDEALARSILTTAHVLVPKREVTVREVELWNEYLGRGRMVASVREALLNYHKALMAEGMESLTLEELEAFYEGLP